MGRVAQAFDQLLLLDIALIFLSHHKLFKTTTTTHSFLTLSSDILTLQSTDPAEATSSPITITISVKLDNYPDIPAAVQTFQIEIVDHCDTTTLSFDHAVTDMLAYVNLGADTHKI